MDIFPWYDACVFSFTFFLELNAFLEHLALGVISLRRNRIDQVTDEGCFLGSLSLVLCFRRELCPFGVRVAIIVPGNFKTSICPDNVQDLLKGLWSQASPEVKKRYGDKYFEGCKFFLDPHRARLAKSLTSKTLSACYVPAGFQSLLLRLLPCSGHGFPLSPTPTQYT